MKTTTQEPIKVSVLLNPLRWYTGYYSLVGIGADKIPKGAFLQIISSGNQNSLFDITSLVISMKGKKAKLYTSGFTIDNVHSIISIDGVGSISLAKNNLNNNVSSFHGKLNGKDVKGTNFLSPVPLEIFSGDFKDISGKEGLIIARNTTTNSPIFNISFDFNDGNGLQAITKYTYDPTMYLLAFENSASKDKYTLMLGTGEGHGLACYVAVAGNPAKNTVLMTVIDEA